MIIIGLPSFDPTIYNIILIVLPSFDLTTHNSKVGLPSFVGNT